MRRLSKAVWLSVAIVAVMVFTDITSRLFLGLAFLMFLRCCMKKEQVRLCNTSAAVHATGVRTTSSRGARCAGDCLAEKPIDADSDQQSASEERIQSRRDSGRIDG